MLIEQTRPDPCNSAVQRIDLIAQTPEEESLLLAVGAGGICRDDSGTTSLRFTLGSEVPLQQMIASANAFFASFGPESP